MANRPNILTALVGFPSLQHRALLNSFAQANGGVGTSNNISYPLAAVNNLAGITKTIWVAPYNGTIAFAAAAVDAAIVTSNITVTLSISGTGVTNGVVTIPFAGSAAGTSGTTTPTALNNFTAGQIITATITGAGAGGGAVSGVINILVTRTS